MKVMLYVWLIVVVMILGGARGSAQNQPVPPDLTTADLEDLMKIEVTSVSKREEKLFQSAAAIYVITQEEIRRSGLTSLPELFRLVPGMEVARIDGTKWAISGRGFNGRFSDKLLVLVDGRSIYSPIDSGVFWEAQQLPLEDIERIEIIRGPGGTLWGANAVNGVINVITKPAFETQGGLVTAGGGSEEQGFTSARYGGVIGARAHYRAYAKYFNRGGLVNAAGFNAHDWQNWLSGGWRMDWEKSERNSLTIQGDLYDTMVRETPTTIRPADPFAPPVLSPGELTGGNVLGRWNHVFSDRSETALQIYFDRARREIYEVSEHTDTFDVDFQHHLALGRRQEIVWGLGYRLINDRVSSTFGTPVQVFPEKQRNQIFSAFVQNELTLVKNRLRLTVGSKLEHNDYMGYEAQPSARLLWMPSQRQTVWAAASRVVKTPARIDRGLRYNIMAVPGPGPLYTVLAVFGNPNFKSEELRAYEFGYRVRPSRKFSLDLATFYNFYDRLRADDAGRPFLETAPPRLVVPLPFGNLLNGKNYGLEASVNGEINRRWKFRGGYSYLGAELNHKLAGQDLNVDRFEGGSPRHQFQLHSYFKLPRNFELNTSLYHVSRLPASQTPRCTRLDAGIGWKVRETIELNLGLQNLLDDRHPESNSFDAAIIKSQVRRSAYGKMTWKF
ncbi:MAG TPA: TonB-dependent receptor [Blastocatellia bacterium]|nr:TonB-dependent receptor [Blastocatellia bacterium]